MATDPFSLGEVPLDSAQTTRKAWDNCALGHRVVPVSVDFNIVEHSYTSTGLLDTVEYFFESKAESSKVTFVADVCASLDGEAFTIHSAKDALTYKIVYSVDCATTKPANTTTTRHILVDIKSNDAAVVIARATELAMEADVKAAVDFSIANLGDALTITNNTKGLATDINALNSGFTVAVLTQGTKISVEKLTYAYDSNGRLSTVTTQSGENKLNLNEPFAEMVSISGDGKVARVSPNSELAVELSPIQIELLEKVVYELRIMNVHLSIITDNDIKKKDLDTVGDL